MYTKIIKLQDRLLFKKVSFKILVAVVAVVAIVVVQFRQAHLKKKKWYRDETLHDDWNS